MIFFINLELLENKGALLEEMLHVVIERVWIKINLCQNKRFHVFFQLI